MMSSWCILCAKSARIVLNVQARCAVQGHALFTRQAGGDLPCPALDFIGGFNQFMAAAYNLSSGTTVAQQFGSAFGENALLVNSSLGAVLQRHMLRLMVCRYER